MERACRRRRAHLQRRLDVGEWSSEGTFTICVLSKGGDAFWGAMDASGHVVVAPTASQPFAFRDGVAEMFVADVMGSVFATNDGRVHADAGYIESRHRAVGRKDLEVDAGGR